ncbi:histidine phosphatase family protein [Shewanella sp. YIC-542]|uniref:histidine phosphatase family protein n=1 Tax=Shewanella mytili TaxID=3377111 RepID=UPI00398F696A
MQQPYTTMPSELYILRHGQTRFNAERRLQGQCNSPLTPRGEQQALAMGHTLRQQIGDIQQWQIVSSPLGRAQQTAQRVCDGLGLSHQCITLDDRVQEVGLGQWEQCQISAILQAHPQFQQQADWYMQAPEGEGFDAVTRRLRHWLSGLSNDSKQIVISHGLTGMILRALLQHLPYEEIWQLERPQDALFHYHDGQLTRIAVTPLQVPA